MKTQNDRRSVASAIGSSSVAPERWQSEKGRLDGESLDRGFAFLDALPGSAAFLDRSGRILAVNERWHSFARENGLPDSHACVGVNYLTVCQRAEGDSQLQAREAANGIGEVLAGTEDTFMLEYACHSPREERWFLMSASSAPYADERGAVVLHLDISTSKADERAQRFLDEYFSTPFQEASIGLAVINSSGRFLQTNEQYCTMLGYTESELKSKDIVSITHPDDRVRNQRLLSELLNGLRRSFVLEKRYITKRGSVIWVRNSVSARRDPLGRVTSVLAFSEDITGQKQAFRELEEAKTLLEMAGRLGRLGAWELDRNVRRVKLSEQAKLIYGLSAEHEPDFEELLSFYIAGDREKLRRAIDECLAHGTAYDLELEIETVGKRRAWVRTIGQVADADGDGINLVQGALQDITERVLFQRNADHVQKMEAIGQLTGGIAHDFNNLLTVVIGNVELLEEQLFEHHLLPLAQSAKSAAERGARLVEHLLAFARRQSLKPKVVDVAKLVVGMTTLLGRTLGRPIGISLSLQSDLGKILADEAQLESAILNLCLNARDAMPRGGAIQIDVRNHEIRSEDDELPSLALGRYVCISITDSGVGMSADVVRRACEPFFTTKDVGKGTGLGLSMVCGFLQQSNGAIRFESELGCGTTVRMYLPHTTASAENPVSRSESVMGCDRILLVDDEPEIRRYSRRQLEELGYIVTECENGDEGLDLLRSGAQFDLLLTDIIMPGEVDGLSLAQRARELHPDLKIILTTGYSEQALTEEVEHGYRLLKKPYRKNDLALKVRAALTV